MLFRSSTGSLCILLIVVGSLVCSTRSAGAEDKETAIAKMCAICSNRLAEVSARFAGRRCILKNEEVADVSTLSQGRLRDILGYVDISFTTTSVPFLVHVAMVFDMRTDLNGDDLQAATHAPLSIVGRVTVALGRFHFMGGIYPFMYILRVSGKGVNEQVLTALRNLQDREAQNTIEKDSRDAWQMLQSPAGRGEGGPLLE
jgi:hypothetical protein